MQADWQTLAAVVVVAVTAILFGLRMAKRKRHGGCSTCGSGGPPMKRR